MAQFPRPFVWSCKCTYITSTSYILKISSGKTYFVDRIAWKETKLSRIDHARSVNLHNDQIGDELFAIKVFTDISAQSETKVNEENQENELAALNYLNNYLQGHPNIIKLYEVCMSNESHEIFAVMECGGDDSVSELVSERVGFTEALAKDYFLPIVNGLRFLHSNNIAHRDMSLENVVVATGGTCKIIDFGVCLSSASLVTNFGFSGEKSYAPPEMFNHVTGAVSMLPGDVWSLGVMLHKLLSNNNSPCQVASPLDNGFRLIQSGHALFD